MTDPIQVLIEAINAAYGGDLDAGRVDAEKMLGRYETALAQVEALVEAAKHVTFAIWMSDGEEEAAADAFVAALAPFKENP